MRVVVINMVQKKSDLALAFFVTYILGRHRIDTTRLGLFQGAVEVGWMILDVASLYVTVLRFINVVYEALIASGLLSYLLMLALEKRGRGRWLQRIAAITAWGMVWAVLLALLWFEKVTQLVLVGWLMTYGAVFPKSDRAISPGNTPPPGLNSPGLAALAQRRARQHT